MNNKFVTSLKPFSWGIVTFVLGVIFSILLAQKIERTNASTMNTLVNNEAEKLANHIIEHIKVLQYGLRGARGHILTQGEKNTSRENFYRYILSRNTSSEFEGSRGLGFIRRVAPDDEAKYVSKIRENEDPSFTIKQLTPHAGERYVIEYIEPVDGNQVSIGLDINSDVARSIAADKAMRTGTTQLTAPITLVQTKGKVNQSFLILLPIYRNWVTPDNVQDRFKEGFGWSYMPLMMDEVLNAIDINKNFYYVNLQDISDDIEPTQFYSNHTQANAHDAGLFPKKIVRTVYGRKWQMDFSITSAFYEAQHFTKPRSVLIWSLVVSLLASILIATLRIYTAHRQRMTRQQARLAAIVKDSVDAIVTTTTDDVVLTWNTGAETIFGYSEAEIIGKKLNSLILPASLKSEGAQLLQRLANGEHIVNYETQRLRHNGTVIDVSLNYSPLFNNKKIITGFSKTLRDISEQKRTQAEILNLNYNLEQQVNQRTQELKQLNQMLENLLDSATQVSIIASDLRGTITVFNSGAERMLGYSADEMVGKANPASIHRSDEIIEHSEELKHLYGVSVEGFDALVYNAKVGEAETRRWTYVHKDGHDLQVSLSVSAMRSPEGELQGYLGVALNITQAEQNQQALIAARDQLSAAATIAELGIWSLEVETGSLSWNDEMFSIYAQPFSLRKQDLNIQHWRERIHPDDLDDTERKLQQTIADGEPFKSVFRLQLPDGSLRYLQSAASGEKDINGNVVRIIGVNRDITIQQNAENYLREAKQRADEASATKSSFLANMSHEIRTPMNAVLGMLHLVQRTQLNQRQQDYIVNAESSAKSLLGLLNDILDFSKMESGKLSFDPQPFELEELMSNLGVLLAANHGDKDVEVLFQLDPNLPRQIIADRLRLQQVLTNLASNALKFTLQGHVIIAVTCVEKTHLQARLHFEISDTGIGISEEQQARIFNGFEQAESSTTRRFGGTGLGLVISKRLVNMMGGELQLSSQVDVGSRFWFDIDLAVADAAPYAELAQQSLTDIRVLVVDDSPLVADILKETLASLGFDVSQAHSGVSAVEMVKNAQATGKPFDAVLMDWRMPEVDGLSAAEFIRTDNQLNKQPIIIMVTAYERELLASQNDRNAPYNELITKPVTPYQMAKSIWQNVTGSPITPIIENQISDIATPLAGLHLLVIEDNALNRQIAEELLQGAGAKVTLADGGLEGVDKVLNGPAYDLVIMDIQMPDIDGYEATRRIRAHEKFAQLPILAMTANASVTDKETCIAAGMDGHVGKPIDMDQLIDNILRLLDLKTPFATPTTNSEESSSTIDTESIILKRFGNNRDLFARMLNNFRPEIMRMLDELTSGCNNNELTSVIAALHSIKGVASTMGARLLAQTAATLETQCKASDVQELGNIVSLAVREKLTQLFELSDSLLNEVAQHKPSAEPIKKPVTSFSTANIKQELRAILPLLEQDDMGAVELIERLCDNAPNHPQLTQIAALIEVLNYTQAIEQIHDLLNS